VLLTDAPPEEVPPAPWRALLLLLLDSGFGRLESNLAVRAIAVRLRDRPAAAAERHARTIGRVDLRAVDVEELDLALDDIRPIRSDRDLDGHAGALRTVRVSSA